MGIMLVTLMFIIYGMIIAKLASLVGWAIYKSFLKLFKKIEDK